MSNPISLPPNIRHYKVGSIEQEALTLRYEISKFILRDIVDKKCIRYCFAINFKLDSLHFSWYGLFDSFQQADSFSFQDRNGGIIITGFSKNEYILRVSEAYTIPHDWVIIEGSGVYITFDCALRRSTPSKTGIHIIHR